MYVPHMDAAASTQLCPHESFQQEDMNTSMSLQDACSQKKKIGYNDVCVYYQNLPKTLTKTDILHELFFCTCSCLSSFMHCFHIACSAVAVHCDYRVARHALRTLLLTEPEPEPDCHKSKVHLCRYEKANQKVKSNHHQPL